ncbi:hypothetical protein BP6252_02829 [Coleophoma cylindrospora]|uniref:Dynactin arp1 p25 subunit protein n=1 Tax=Coleophoma cylindrospora TaxID=1849047 RepID=A0A3D8SFX6_9HELO|nr:hypothetical protein BP6252_02829 [Coleophoma cylindrospora]
MYPTKPVVLSAIALGSLLTASVSASADPEWKIVRRQDGNESVAVGTNLYNCHDNCGEAILEEEVDGYCNSTIFSTDYAACLQCAGSDNEDIWQYYGPYLTEGAAACGSSTAPLSGTQANVTSAIAAQTEASAASTTASSLLTSATAGATTTTGSASPASTATGTSASSTASSTATSFATQIQPVGAGIVAGLAALLVACNLA